MYDITYTWDLKRKKGNSEKKIRWGGGINEDVQKYKLSVMRNIRNKYGGVMYNMNTNS